MPKLNADANDPYDLRRFLDAQASTFAQARRELADGQKESHWMWFIFPQIRGLGSSAMAQRFAISGLDEAAAYLAHPVLGSRLRECATLVNAANGRSLLDIFGYPDNLKFHSSMSLFAQAALHVVSRPGAGDQVFTEALVKYFDGKPDQATLDRLRL